MKTGKHPFVSFAVNWAWVFLFILTVSIAYAKAYSRRQENYEFFSSRLEVMKGKKKEALRVNTALTKRVNSQSDPEWIELTLKRGLGLVPEGQTKIHFREISP